jgi:hypothetical protein
MKLNTALKTLGFLALAATPVVAGTTAPAPKNPVAPAPAVNDDLGLTAGLGYHTNYIWRGINMGQHWVDASLAGAIPLIEGTRLAWDVNYGSLASDQDHLLPANPGNVQNLSFQRLQLGAAIQHDIGAVTASLGYRYYRNMGGLANPGGALGAAGFGMQDGQEVSLGLATALGPINVATSANYDYVNDSWYFDFDANTSIAITDSITLVPFANIGYGKNMNWQGNAFNGNLFTNGSGRDDVTGWTALNTGLRLQIKLSSRATLTPYIAANVPLGTTNSLAANVVPFGGPPGINDTPFKSVLTGGITLSVRF